MDRILYRRILPYLAAALVAASCSSVGGTKAGGKSRLIIRYINLNAVYISVAGRDREAQEIETSKAAVLKSIIALEEQLAGKSEDREKITGDLAEKRKKLLGIKKDEEYRKSKLYNKINSAVKAVAKKLDADYILNIGDEVVYAKKKYDVTEEVMREILSMEKRSAPVSR
ncbi:MAG: OmpH family outer membrane protein [bacterium]|nr:OmpH family outer membrane protein [bacterium]